MDPAESSVQTEVRPDQGEVAAFQSRAKHLLEVPMALVRKSDIALRGVNRKNEEFMNIVESVRRKGVLIPVLMRELRDPSNGTLTYSLIDGLQRYTASLDCGLTTIPAHVVEMDDAEALEAQIMTNANRVITKPAEYAKHLLRMLTRDPFMTMKTLATKVSQSESWVLQRLSLDKLLPKIQELVDNDKIGLTNAYALAKLPEDEQGLHVDAAMTEAPQTFVPRMKSRAKEIKEANKAGKDVNAPEFQPVQYMQKPADVKAELKSPSIGTHLLAKNGLTGADAQSAWTLALNWVMHFDEDSKAEQQRNFETKKAKKDAEKAKLKEEKDKEAAKKAAQLDMTKV